MALEYVIYADESDQRGDFYSNFYGGALVRSTDLPAVITKLDEHKAELGFNGEVKWQKVTKPYLQKYKDLMSSFFAEVAEGRVKIRIMFTSNSHVPNNLTKYHYDRQYHLLYYQFIKHAFGLRYSAEDREGKTRVRLYLDKMPDTKEKNQAFKGYLAALSRWPGFRAAGVIVDPNQIAEVRSHDHVVLQCLDVVLGSIQAKLNDKFKLQPGQTRRGNRTLAKEKLYRHINQLIRHIYPGFNVGKSTGTQADLRNRWRHPYRHWEFVTSDSTRDLSKTKRSQK